MNNYLIKNARIVNKGVTILGFVLVRGAIIRAVGKGEPVEEAGVVEVIDAGATI